eukprot:3795507-Alexandrium_andersonii.AAC.1
MSVAGRNGSAYQPGATAAESKPTSQYLYLEILWYKQAVSALPPCGLPPSLSDSLTSERRTL